MKFWRAVSNSGLPGAPKSRQKTSYRPPSAVSPSDARDVVSGTTCARMGQALRLGTRRGEHHVSIRLGALGETLRSGSGVVQGSR